MDNLFYEKYLKYKAKYLALGGVEKTKSISPEVRAQQTSDRLSELLPDNPIPNSDPTVKSDDKKVVQSSPLAVTCTCNL